VPVRQGQLVELRARIASTGTTSMRVDVDLCSEDLITGDRQLATRGRFVMVALDAHRRPAQIPAITVDTHG
jgi:acyl-CoA hydrolase